MFFHCPNRVCNHWWGYRMNWENVCKQANLFNNIGCGDNR